MKKQLPREGILRQGPGEHDVPDVEGHGIGDSLNRPIEKGIPGEPGSDRALGQPRTGGELTGSNDEDSGFGPTHTR
jgi:hypothetical protein